MRKMRFLMPIVFLAMAAGFSAIVMLLWNWLVPTIFGLTVIDFWQAVGLLILARILFGGFGHGRGMMRGMHGMHGHSHLREKWMKMTPEERQEFMKKRQAYMHGHHHERCGRDFFDEQRDVNPTNEANTAK